MIQETDTPEISAFADEAARVEYPLKILMSMPDISKICFNHLETVEEDIALRGFTKLSGTCGSFTSHDFLLNK